MKLFLQYLRWRRRLFIVGVVFCFIFAVSFLLYHLPIGAVIYPTLLCSALGILIMVFDFIRVKREHEALQTIRSITDTIGGTFPKIDGIKDEDYCDRLKYQWDTFTMEYGSTYKVKEKLEDFQVESCMLRYSSLESLLFQYVCFWYQW